MIAPSLQPHCRGTVPIFVAAKGDESIALSDTYNITFSAPSTSAMSMFTISKALALLALAGAIYTFILQLVQRKQFTAPIKPHKGIKQQEGSESHDREARPPVLEGETPTPVSVNYHFTRKCNKTCGFCFHTERTSHVATDEHMKKALQMLKDAGMRKVNFAGGEPFLYPKRLAMLCRFAKVNLQLESVSIITNGTKVTEKWMRDNSQYIDILGVSCDSFDEETNIRIGRGTGENVTQLFRIRDWCSDFGVKFKLNSVVCKLNWQEDMSSIVSELEPCRWKCFQVLVVEDENDASETSVNTDPRKRNAKELLISDQQYEAFCDKHKHVANFVPESNGVMASSYLILDEYLCFLDKGSGKELQSPCILDVGVREALSHIRWDKYAFFKRGGIYDWSKPSSGSGLCGSELPENLQF